MSQVVFAEPGNKAARELAADAMEQMGYQAESATWRNAYLFGAHGIAAGQPVPAVAARAGRDIVRGLTLDLLFDFLGVRLNGDKAAGQGHRRQLGVLRYWRALRPHLAELRADLSRAAATPRPPTPPSRLERSHAQPRHSARVGFAGCHEQGLVSIEGDADKDRRSVRPARRLQHGVQHRRADARPFVRARRKSVGLRDGNAFAP